LSSLSLEYDTFKDYNPTYEELLDKVVARSYGLGYDRAKGIVDFLIKKKALTVFEDGKLYRTMVLIPGMPLTP
jgi:hypothetical protein